MSNSKESEEKAAAATAMAESVHSLDTLEMSDSVNGAPGGGTSSPRAEIDTTTFTPSSVAQHYSTQIGHVQAAAPPASSIRAESTPDDDVFNLARHYQSAAPVRNSKMSPHSTQGFFAQRDQMNVDQSVNFMDHSRANYAPPTRKKSNNTTPQKRVSKRTSFVDIFLGSNRTSSTTSGGGRSGITSDTIDEEDEGREGKNWTRVAANFLLLLSFGVGATFLALSVPHLARGGRLSEEEMEERVSSIRSSLLKSGLSDQSDLLKANTSQQNALEWLSRTDPAQLDLNDPRIHTRYALAVFYFSNRAEADHEAGQRYLLPEWDNHDKWMTGVDVCYWYGIECDVTGDNNQKDVVGWNMTNNGLQGRIPSELKALSNLVSLDLSSNQMTGPIPDEIYGLPFLKNLILSENALTGTISEEIGYLYPAEHIDISRNTLRGTIPHTINTAVNLKHLSLAGNDLKGVIPEMERLTKLVSLNLDNNMLVGKFPSSLTRLPGLSQISMEDNSLSGSLPDTIGALSSLEVLSLGHNRFDGGIPDNFDTLHNLTEVRLQKNLLQSKLPSTLGALPKLKRIMLDNNKLVGPIPPEWMSLTQLEALIIHANQLTGSISSTIGYLEHVKDLWLNTNHFAGELPTHLGLLTSLNTLYLQDNLFAGSLPTEIGMLQDLQALRVAGNELFGVVPNEVCALKGKDELVFFSATCSRLRCICCDKCS